LPHCFLIANCQFYLQFALTSSFHQFWLWFSRCFLIFTKFLWTYGPIAVVFVRRHCPGCGQ
jgi:hypothetical protein